MEFSDANLKRFFSYHMKNWNGRNFSISKGKICFFISCIAHKIHHSSFSWFIIYITISPSIHPFFHSSFCSSFHLSENSSPRATVTLFPIWKRGISKWGILYSLVSIALNCTLVWLNSFSKFYRLFLNSSDEFSHC